MRSRTGIFLCAALLLLAFALRSVGLAQLPPGLSHDEAYNGITALDILGGKQAVFFDIKNGTEALYLYMQAGAIALLGASDWALRWVSIVCAMLTIPLTCLLGRRFFGVTAALLSVVGLTVSFWAVFVNRLALRINAMLPLELAAFIAYWAALQSTERRRKLALSALAGFFVGLSLYTYLSARFLPFVFVLYYACGVLRSRRPSSGLTELLVLLAVAALVFVPLGWYFYTHPDTFTTRAGQVNDLRFIAWSGDFGPLLHDTLNTLGMFGQSGDPSWRYNAAGRPVFDFLGAAFFYLGLGLCLWRAVRSRAGQSPEVFCLLWLLVMLTPGFITGESPHFLRVAGALPVTFLLFGLGLATAWEKAQPRLGPWGRRALLGGAALWFAFNCWWTCRDYFVLWATNAEARHIYGADFGEMARYLKSYRSRDRLCISGEYYKDLDRYRFDMLMNRRMGDVKWFDGRRSLVLPKASEGEALYLFPESAPAQPALARRALQETGDVPPGSAFSAYRPRSDADLAAEQPVEANLLDVARVTGVDLEGGAEAGQKLGLVLHWEVIRGVVQNLNLAFFVHLVDERGYLWAQIDGNDYATPDWRPGDRVLQWLEMELPPDMPPGRYRLVGGMFHLESGQRLSLLDAQGRPSGTEVELGRVEVAPASKVFDPSALDIPNPAQGRFADEIEFLGYGITQAVVNRGEKAQVSLYWKALADLHRDYLLVPLLVHEGGKTLALPERQPDYPTGRWRAGQLIRDRLDVATKADWERGVYHLFAGWRDPQSGELLPLAGADRPAVALGDIFVSGRERLTTPPPIAHPQRADFGGQVVLLGYDLPAGQVKPGETLPLTLYWQAAKEMEVSYTVFTHLLDGQGVVWGQQDNLPDGGSYPTTGWTSGEVVIDRYNVPLRPDTPAGRYQLEVGLYDAATGERLSALDEAGRATGDRVLLGEVEVVSK